MYREAASLKTLHAEINEAAPDRSIESDGWIGDAAHASRTSDHNPWVIDPNGIGVVRARDFTDDPPGGLDCNDLAEFLAGLLGKHPALGSGAYIIWNRRIISTDRLAEGWRPYTGSNDHTHHLHLSVALAAAGYDSTAPWGWPTEEDDMPYTEKQLKDIVTAAVKPIADDVAATKAEVERLRKGSYRRDQRLVELARGTKKSVDELIREIDQAD